MALATLAGNWWLVTGHWCRRLTPPAGNSV